MKQLLHQQATNLRRLGFSYRQIAEKLSISQSTCSLWLRHIKLSKKAQEKLTHRQISKRAEGREILRDMRSRRDAEILVDVQKVLSAIKLDRATKKLLCALLYWSEGNKDKYKLAFTNSDPKMIQLYLLFLREVFDIKEEKIGAILHLHEYHNRGERIAFWSKITNIPKNRISIYLKPHTGKNKKINYPGCIAIQYNDVRLAKEVKFLYTVFTDNVLSGGVV